MYDYVWKCIIMCGNAKVRMLWRSCLSAPYIGHGLNIGNFYHLSQFTKAVGYGAYVQIVTPGFVTIDQYHIQ